MKFYSKQLKVLIPVPMAAHPGFRAHSFIPAPRPVLLGDPLHSVVILYDPAVLGDVVWDFDDDQAGEHASGGHKTHFLDDFNQNRVVSHDIRVCIPVPVLWDVLGRGHVLLFRVFRQVEAAIPPVQQNFPGHLAWGFRAFSKRTDLNGRGWPVTLLTVTRPRGV